MITDFSTGISELFDRLKSGLKRFGDEPVTIAPDAVYAPDGSRVLFLVRDGYELKDAPQAERNVRGHTFFDVESFAAWLTKHGQPEKAEILATDDNRIVAALDPRDIDGDLVKCTLELHPRFTRWNEVFTTPQTQTQLHELFLCTEDDTDRMKNRSGDDIGSQAEQLAREVRKVEITGGHNFKHQIDERGMTVFSSADESTALTGKLPTSFYVTVPVFRGIKVGDDPASYRFKVRLMVEAAPGNAPAFFLTCPDLPMVMDNARQDAAKHLAHKLGDKWLVGHGRIDLDSCFDRDARLLGGSPPVAEK